MARKFVVRIESWDKQSMMTPISVELPEGMVAGEYDEAHLGIGNWTQRRWHVNPYAVAFCLGRIVEELARYGLSEALGAYDPNEKPK